MAQTKPRQYPLGSYGLSIVLAVLFLVCWIAQTYAGWKDFVAEQAAQGQVAQWVGDHGYMWRWLSQTMENWQSEFLQLLTFVILTAHLVHIGSHESKDNDDDEREQFERIETTLGEVLDRVKKLESA